MNYTEKQIARYHRSGKRFEELLAMDPVTAQILAEEGAIMIETLVAIAGPEVMLCYARNAWKRSVELDGLCPWDHADDRSLHPVVRNGACAEHLTEK